MGRSRCSPSAGLSGYCGRSYGPTTNRRHALAELVRGAEVNAQLGGVPGGDPLFDPSKASVFPNCDMCIVMQLPASGPTDGR